MKQEKGVTPENTVAFPGAPVDAQPEAAPVEPGSAGICYLAGPMTGYPEYNFAAFLAAGSILAQEGWDVRNPAQHDLEMGFDPRSEDPISPEMVEDFIAWDTDQILNHATKVFALRGWMSSKGAVAEVALAQWKRIPVQQIAIGKHPETGQIQFGYGPEAPSISEICSYVENSGANV
jgi:hypothetical protein